ncbi:MAG: hypothetical protein JWQ89_984 [Devosia sp.]|uniref:hypothetical protein n=1 Tax=Devosia sp. TaxID=1871048 RepID=UPI0026368090|nr:hypothetical protein [Devosia sp.]MDB5539257.1 hypothetical protein [Devosia sp.]
MSERNPFAPDDADRFSIWEMLVRRDTDFFLSGDWSPVATDYVENGFLGIDAALSLDPANWRPAYSRVAAYRDAAIAARWNPADFAEPLRSAWFRCQSIVRVDINGDAALAHKRIEGHVLHKSGEPMSLAWRSVFHLRRENHVWKIAGFTGYLPLD